MNRSTIYEWLRDNSGLEIRTTNIGKGKYLFAYPPFIWENSYLIINDVRITDFKALILFSNELVVRFWTNDTCQINIPYKIINSIKVSEFENVGYASLYDSER